MLFKKKGGGNKKKEKRQQSTADDAFRGVGFSICREGPELNHYLNKFSSKA